MICNGAPPVLLKVTTCGLLVEARSWPGKVRADGVRLASGTTPVPERAAPGTPLLVNIENPPLRAPTAVGWKTTLIVQLAPWSKEEPQLFISAKSPFRVNPRICSGPNPVLVNVIACGALLVFTSWFPKLRLEGDSCPIGLIPVPLKETLKVPWFVLMTMEPGRLPTPIGAKDTFTRQFGAAIGGPKQLFVWV